MNVFYSIQALRGVAVLLVVAFHATLAVRDHLDQQAHVFYPGAAGVDLFFVISGFIIAITTAKKWGTATAAQNFLPRRIIRIYPLYWLATTLKLLILLAVPSLALNTELQLWHTLASYLLIPAWNQDHYAFPILPMGWTLSFEMFFYFLFWLALRTTKRPVEAVTPLLLLLAALAWFDLKQYAAIFTLLDPLLLEFVAGLWIALACLRQRWLSRRIAQALVVLATVALLATHWLSFGTCLEYRALVWGLPMAVLVYALLSLEAQHGLPRWRWLEALGDASYAIYLFQGFVIAVLGVAAAKLHLTNTPLVAGGIIGMALVACAVFGWLVYRYAEKPLLDKLRGFVSGKPTAGEVAAKRS